jgi:hypothetical protein
VVDSLLGEMDYGTSIAIDSQNKAHISYCDYHNGALKYATNASGDWVITTLDAVGRFSSIALDSQEKVHISYYDSCLKYATNASGDWVITTVDSSVPVVGMYTSIAIDSRDHVHISYHDEVEDCLKYATNASGDWVVAIIDDSEGDVGRPTSIVIDSQNVVHISYGANQNLKYARNSSAGWVNTTIYSSGDIGYSSITVDSQNNVHVSCYDMGSGTEGLKHITNASGDWVVTSVNVNNVGRYNSIAIDSKDYIYIPYNDYANYDLKCATNNPRPVAPSDLTATVISSSQINLNWVDNSDNESVFKIERKTEEAGIYEEIDMVREDVTAYSDIELGAGVTYYYRVRASNEFGDSTYSNEASAITLAPGWEESIETISGSISQKKLAEKDKTMYEIRDNLLLNSPKGIQIKDSIYKMIGKVALYAREDSQIREQVFECMNILIDKGQKFLNGENKDSQRPDKRIRAKALQTLNLLEAKAILKGDTDFLADIQEAKDIVKELSGLKVSELKKELNINTQIQIR